MRRDNTGQFTDQINSPRSINDPLMQTGDAQWMIVPERGDLDELRAQVGEKLLKCLSRDRAYPRDVRDTIIAFINTEPWSRRLGDLEDLQMDDPRMGSRSTSRACLSRFESDLIQFLRPLADPDSEAYLNRFSRLLKQAAVASLRSPWKRLTKRHDPFDDSDADDDSDSDDDDDDSMPLWLIILIVLLLLCILGGIGYGLYWFFRKRRLERRAIIAAAAAAG